MLDIKRIKEDPEKVKAGLRAKEVDCDQEVDRILELDKVRRDTIFATEQMKAEQNKVSKTIPQLKKAGEDTAPVFQRMGELKAQIAANDEKLRSIEGEYRTLMLSLPNLPDDDFRNLYVTNPSSRLPRLSASTTNANNRVSDLYVEDGSYIRLQNISLGYTLPKSFVRKLKLENVKVYMNLQNVYTWTNYSGYDPEVGSMYGDALLTGLDYGRYPSPRIYTFGLNISF